jgi:phosphoglycerate dehydrogenase-like enzyme
MTDRLLVVDLAAISKNWALPPEGEQRIRDATPPGWRIHVVRAPTSSDGDGPPRPSDEVMDAIVDAEAYYGFGMPKLLFAEAKRLKWIHSSAAGVGNSMYPEMLASDVVFSNSAGVHGSPIAEYIVAGILHFLRGLDIAIDQQHRKEWSKTDFVRMDSVLREVDSVHALIIGVGGLGGGAGERLAALGAHVTGVRRRVELGPPPGFERVISLDDLDSELPNHDVVVLAAPLTAETNRILTAERLDLLPRNAIVVNVARGAMIDQDALTARLTDGRIRGAVLDVFREEPLPPESPLWGLRQALLTPHVSPVSPGRYWPRQLDLFLDNWSRYLRGEPLRNVVDKRAGY